MVNVTMRADNVIDCGRIDLRLVEAAKETTGRRAERLRSAHATVEHDESAARIQEQHVLLEDKIVSRQEVVGECLGQFLFSWAFQRSGWLSQRQRPVGDHGCLKLADHEAIEIGDLAADDWGAGLAVGMRKPAAAPSPTAVAPRSTVRLGIVVWDICIFSRAGIRGTGRYGISVGSDMRGTDHFPP